MKSSVKWTRNTLAKTSWWSLVTVSLFLGAVLGLIGLFGWMLGCYTPSVTAYWETENAERYLYLYTMKTLNTWSENKWGAETLEPETDVQASYETDLFRYTLTQVTRYGDTMEVLDDKAFLGDRGRLVYRAYVEIYPDQNYDVIGTAQFRDGEQWIVRNSDGMYWDSYTESVTLQYTGSEEYDARRVRFGQIDLYVNEEGFQSSLPTPCSGLIQGMYRNYNTFQTLRHTEKLVMVGFPICVVLGLISIVMLGLGTGWTENGEKPQLCWFDWVPMELQLGLLAMGLYFGFWMEFSVVDDLWQAYAEGGIGRPFVQFICVMGSILPTLMGLATLMVFYSWLRWAKQGHPLSGFVSLRLLVISWRGIVSTLRDTLRAMPLMWQGTLLMAGAAVLQFLYTLRLNGNLAILVGQLLVWAVAFLFVAHAARSLEEIRRQLNAFADGDYQAKSTYRSKYPVLREIGERISQVGGGMNAAVEQRMKSERMKTELITNVSHDLKTPLTSIINYTDLLQKEELPPQAEEYAKIIARQGERLHKLTVDLVEASKAASGVLTCNKEPTDVNELCQQALGEYIDRLADAGLTPVLDLPEQEVTAELDGRLTWRILDNLLSNACKYAQPGTRVYMTVSQQESSVLLMVKNISREQLNVPAEELMERFVRGDSARNSEGSGLGLSIARSLAELQGGKFHLYINGDLFQAEMVFPLK